MRRKNGEGTIYRRAINRLRGGLRYLWVGELTLGYSEGRRIKKTHASKDLSALQRALNNSKVIIDGFKTAEDVIDDGGHTVASWAAHWLETYRRPTIKASTYDRYEDTFNFYVKNNIGRVSLGAVKGEDVQKFYNALFDDGLSTSTIKKCHVLLSGAFEQALTAEMLRKNPCQGVKIPKKPPQKQTALTAAEEETFTACCGKSPTYGDFFLFALNTGMRCGEITALTWADIDLENRLITVDKTAYAVKTRKKDGKPKPREGGGSARTTTITTPKTKSGSRAVPMNKVIFDMLSSRLESRPKKQAPLISGALPVTVATSALVFPNANGEFLSQRNIRRALAATMKHAGIEKHVTVHSLRHTFATRLVEKGANIKVISELLGHASVKITLDTYSHVSPDLKRSAVTLLDG